MKNVFVNEQMINSYWNPIYAFTLHKYEFGLFSVYIGKRYFLILQYVTPTVIFSEHNRPLCPVASAYAQPAARSSGPAWNFSQSQMLLSQRY